MIDIKKIKIANKDLIRKILKEAKEKILTRSEILKSFDKRVALFAEIKKGKLISSFNPNDNFNVKDVAFGLLKNNQFIAATDFAGVDKNEPGYISHISMLQAANLVDSEKLETEFKADEKNNIVKREYITRGIVKEIMQGAVAFWETAEQIIENDTIHRGVIKCLIELKKRKLITDNTKVYGAGIEVPITTVKKMLDAK